MSHDEAFAPQSLEVTHFDLIAPASNGIDCTTLVLHAVGAIIVDDELTMHP